MPAPEPLKSKRARSCGWISSSKIHFRLPVKFDLNTYLSPARLVSDILPRDPNDAGNPWHCLSPNPDFLGIKPEWVAPG